MDTWICLDLFVLFSCKFSVIAMFSSVGNIKRPCVWNTPGWADTSPLWTPLCTRRLCSKWALSPFAAALLKSCNRLCRWDWRDLTFRDLGSRQRILVRNVSCKAAQPSPTALGGAEPASKGHPAIWRLSITILDWHILKNKNRFFLRQDRHTNPSQDRYK